MKAQVLADFLVECTVDEHLPAEAKSSVEAENSFDSAEAESKAIPENTWTLHVDGASNEQGSRAGLILKSPEGVVAEYAL